MRNDRGVPSQDLTNCRRPQVKSRVGVVGDYRLRHLSLARVRDVNDLEHFGKLFNKTLINCPPRISTVDDLLLRGSLHDFPRSSGNWQPRRYVEVGEFKPILAFEDVLRDDVKADVELVGHEVEELRTRPKEADLHGVRINLFNRIDIPLNLRTTPQARVVFQVLKRVRNIVCPERSAVRPGNPLAEVDGQLGKVIVVLP